MKYVAVSGGMDSMCLLHYLSHSHPSKDLVALHYVYEDEFSQQVLPIVHKFCETLGVTCITSDVHISKTFSNNQEKDWRDGRYKFFSDIMSATKGNILYLGHHIDDQLASYVSFKMKHSIENIKKGIKQGELRRRVFIPVVKQESNHLIIRPFYNLTKQDIKDKVRDLNIPYLEDPENYSSGQRSRTNEELLPLIKSIYPAFESVFYQDYKNYLKKYQITI